MIKHYQILLVEDHKEIARQVSRQLETLNNIDVHRFSAGLELHQYLDRRSPDIVVIASSLSEGVPTDVINRVQASTPATPFIVVSNSINTEQASKIFDAGAFDFLELKHLVRLPELIRRELQYQSRYKQAQKELIQSNEKLQRAEKIARIGHWKIDLNSSMLYPSEGFKKIYGISKEGPLPFKEVKKFALDKYRAMLDKEIDRLVRQQTRYDVEYEIRNPQTGVVKHIRNIAIYDPQGPAIFGVLMDISDQIKNQVRLKRAEHVAQIGHWELDVQNNQVVTSQGTRDILGLVKADPIAPEEIWKLVLEPYRKDQDQYLQHLINQGTTYETDYKIRHAQTGEVRWVHAIAEYDEVRATVFGILQDITKRKQIEEELRKSEARYQSLFEENHATMLLINPENMQIVDANPAAIEFYGYTSQELTSMNVNQINTLPADTITNLMKKAVKEEKNQFEFVHHLADGSKRDVIVYSGPIRIQDEDLLYSIIFDNTERKKAEEELRKLSAATEQSPALICITDRKGIIEYVNPKFAEVTGYSRSELIGENPRILKSGVQSDKFYHKFWNTITNGEVFQGEFTNKKKNGDLYHVIVSVAPITNEQGEIKNYIAVQEDITQRKQNELKLRQTLEEKEVLLREIHHRVKNNLAVVSGIMELQAFEEENKQLRYKLHDSISRIQTMAAIHELLYQSDSFAHLNFEQTLKKLTNNLLDAYHSREYVDISYDIPPLKLNINQALPMALIANEVITNALKYAFDEHERGAMRVSIEELENHIIMKIADDGHGFSNDKDQKKQKSLGMTLIDTLTHQLGGESTFQTDTDGTTFILEFEKKDPKGSASALL